MTHFRRLLCRVLPLTAAMAMPAGAGEPVLNFYGVPGLMDMPSAEQASDGTLWIGTASFGPITRTNLTFVIAPRLSGTFRYSGIAGLKLGGFGEDDTYFDRSFDLRYQLLDEGRFLPAVAVGAQDFIGTGLLSGEYIVASKTILPGVTATAGLGWGRLGSLDPIGTPFGERPDIDVGKGGKPSFGHLFRGPAAPFAGLEWQVTDRLSVKAEYSSDAYEVESGVLERKSPLNYGLTYVLADRIQLGAYSMYGAEVGISATMLMDPKKRSTGGQASTGPRPIVPRPDRAADPDAWSPEWVDQPGVTAILASNVQKRLDFDGLKLEALSVTGTTARLRLRNPSIDAGSQAVGRAARALAETMPASVERFEIVPVVAGIPAGAVVIQRSDLEALEYAPGNADALRARVAFADARGLGPDAVRGEDLYPKLTWSFGPYVEASVFDPDAPLRADLGLRLAGRYDLAPGLSLSGSVARPLTGNIGSDAEPSTSVLPRVRSDVALYYAEDTPVFERLTVDWYARPADNIYTHVAAGYLERMFGGIAVEALWKRPDSPFGLGLELAQVQQRDFDGRFGFQDYGILTGHVSAYYAFGNGYLGQLDVGRYLAGDFGATLSLDREFGNGWKVGAFATITDVPAEEFGEGSFDKGLRLSIPLNWVLGNQTRSVRTTELRSLSRDGGARLGVEGRLYPMVREYHADRMDQHWGRVWK